MDLTCIDTNLLTVKGVYDEALSTIFSIPMPMGVYNPVIKYTGIVSENLNNVVSAEKLPSLGSNLYEVASSEIENYYKVTTGSCPENLTGSWSYINFLLKTSVCYVEVIETTGKVQKFTMCSNLELLKHIGDTSKLNGLATALGVTNKEVRGVKINKTKLTKPRTPIDLTLVDGIRVVPLCILNAIATRYSKELASEMYTFIYRKDGGQARELVSTLSFDILNRYYSTDKAQEMLSGSGQAVLRGFLRLPEVGASKYDSGVRALNVTKITSVDTVKDNEVDTSFINVDFDGIVPMFKETVAKLRGNKDFLLNIISGLSINVSDAKHCSDIELITKLIEWVDIQKAIGSTTFLRVLHKYMCSDPMIFMGYSGERREVSNFTFNLGVEDNPSEYGVADGGEFVFN